VLQVNSNSLVRLGNFKIRREIKVEVENVDVPLYLIERNNPDCLLGNFTIDLEELITHQNIVYDISEIAERVGDENISFLTPRHFEHYQLCIVDEAYIHVVGKDSGHNSQKFQVTTQNPCHVEIGQEDGYITIRSKVASDQFNSIGLYQRMFRYYVIGDTPDQLIDYLDVDFTNLRTGMTERFKVDYDIKDVNFVWMNPKLVTGIRKTE